MAGPMVGPLLEQLGARPRDDLLGAGRRVPRPRAEPAAAGEPRVHHRQGASRGRRPRHRLGRRRRPLLLHRRHRASSSTATSSPRCSPSDLLAKQPGRRHPLRRARLARGARHRRAARRHARTSTASATPSSRPACATRAAIFGGEVSGHYYFQRLLQRRLGHDPGAADPRDALASAARSCRELLEPLPLAVLHLRRDQLRGRRPAGQDGRDRGALRRRPRSPTSTASRSTTTTGTSTCARRTPSRCCA